MTIKYPGMMKLVRSPEYPRLQVSDAGDVIGPSGRVLKAFVGSRGYRCINLYQSGKWKQLRVHSLVCEAFHGPRPLGAQVRHLNGNPLDNRAYNLAWGSQVENEADKVEHGTLLQGEGHHQHKLTTADVLAIRSSADQGISLARRYGVTPQAISLIRTRRTWRHI